MLSIKNLLETEGQDHLRKKVITMELLRRLLMMNSHPNVRKVMEKYQGQVQCIYGQEM